MPGFRERPAIRILHAERQWRTAADLIKKVLPEWKTRRRPGLSFE